MDLTHKKCKPCEGGVLPMNAGQAEQYMAEISGWQFNREIKEISKEFEFKDFKLALKFINQIGELAESEGHHPDIFLHDWNKVKLALSTHTIGGLSENDFILAAKIDELEKNR
jgi:4a-hydroxytetrahydrobiopterin dehydratase